MSLIPWDPFSDVFQLWRQQFDNLTADFWRSAGPVSTAGVRIPRVEVLEEGPDLVVRAELPGIDPGKLDVRVTDRTLSLRGEYSAEQRREDQSYYHSERHYGAFVRTLTLPTPVESAQAKATFKNGILEVRAPRQHLDGEAGGRRLSVNVH